MKNITCKVCGTEFCMSDEIYQNRKDDGLSFWCPAGHSLVFTESRAEIIKELKAENQALKDRADYFYQLARKRQEEIRQLERRINGYKGYIVRVKNQQQRAEA